MFRHRFRLRKSWSLVVITVLIVTFFLLFPAYVLYTNYTQTMLEEMTKRALAVANTTASFLALDSLPYIELSRSVQKDATTIDKQNYASMHAMFDELRKNKHGLSVHPIQNQWNYPYFCSGLQGTRKPTSPIIGKPRYNGGHRV